MKRVIQFLFLLSLVVLTLDILAQELPSSNPKFIVGAYMHSTPWGNTGPPSYHPQDSSLFSLWRAKSLGINTAMVYVRQTEPDSNIFYEGIYPGSKPTNMEALRDFPNVISMNTYSAYRLLDGTPPPPDSPNMAIRNFDYIYFYTGAYYSKWDATQSSIPQGELGLKHDDGFGSKITFNGKEYWSSGLGHSECLLVKGPNYYQETRYRGSAYPTIWDNEVQTYEVNFNMLLKTPPLPSQLNDPVCEISVISKYTTDNFATTEYETLATKVLTAGEIGETVNQTLAYDYSDYCQNAFLFRLQEGLCDPGAKQLIDVEFRVKYLNPNHELLIDFIEIYDNNIWKERLSSAFLKDKAKENIVNYLNKFKTTNPQFYANNLKYFIGVDEPHTVDALVPHAFVQSVLDSLNNVWPEGAPQLFTHLYPEWNGLRNDAWVIPPFVQTVKPKPFHFYYEPFTYGASTEEGLKLFNEILIQATEAIGTENDFWITIETLEDPDDFLDWRLPTPTELNASVMLALAYGAKGIFFETFYSYGTRKGLMEPFEPYAPGDIGIQVRDFIAPRLNGILGSTLLNLSFNGNDLMLRDVTDPQVEDKNYSNIPYLILTNNPINSTLNFFATDLDTTGHTEDNYFLLSNLITDGSRVAEMNVQSPIGVEGRYKNTRLRNIEPENNFDITFYDDTTLTYNFPAGEGYLFQVAPVVLYGGRLLYNETVGGSWTLYDDMIIENGATLTVTGTYNANANITVKDGGSIKTIDGGEIIFSTGKRLIIDGLATVKGTASQKLTLDFNDQELTVEGSGIQVNLGSDFTLSNCIVKNSSIGLSVLMPEIQPAFQNLNINNSTFDNCGTAININGNPVIDSKVKNCLITNSSTGIVVTNNNKITVQSNTITNSDLGIFLEFTSNTNIIGNQINSTLESMPGILMSSSGGQIRTNTITGHTIAISLANSSPKIGGNTIYGNLINGIYISTGSQPDLRPAFAGNPPNMFPLSGYNLIYENGGYEATPLLNDDGSEIFINDGFIKLADGCNQIMDDRIQNQNLITTLLLMNSNPNFPVSTIKADTNYWSEVNFNPSGRFGNLTVQYQPYLIEPCILPQSGGQMLVTQSSTGDVIDTLYSSGVDVGTLTGIDVLYAQADQYYVTAQTEQAKTVYEQIITDYPDDPKSIYAYSAVFMLTRLSGDSTQFSALRELYQQRLTTVTDTLLSKTLSQLSALCFVNEQDYQSAITYFEEIMNNQPNTDAALFAEIDALTTSIIAGSDTTQLGKGTNNRILVKGTADYLSKVNNLLKGRFGYQKPEEEKIIPEQYFLYQNYPNPFNPTTSIKFDLPKAGNVELIVYDILGRKVKQLLNERKPAGTYEITFNASNFASGVYIYTIKSNDFTASKKLMLLK